MARRKRKEGGELSIFKLATTESPYGDVHFKSAVVAAFDAEDAKQIHPSGDDSFEFDPDDGWGDDDADDMWVAPWDVVAEKIGTAETSVERGVILAALNDDEEE